MRSMALEWAAPEDVQAALYYAAEAVNRFELAG